MMNEKAKAKGWNTLDLWNLVPADQFTNSAIHLTPAGESSMAEAGETGHSTSRTVHDETKLLTGFPLDPGAFRLRSSRLGKVADQPPGGQAQPRPLKCFRLQRLERPFHAPGHSAPD